MKARKILSTLLCIGMLASLVAGCGSQKAETAAAPAAETTTDTVAEAETTAPAQAAEIHYAYWQEALGSYLEECKANFEAQNPGVTVVLEPVAWDEYWTKLETAATGGSAADVFQLNGPNINKYAAAGVVLNLDDYISNSSVDLKNYPEAMNELYSIDGSQYGIPIDYDTIGLWYNKELFDKAGLEYPDENWTWDDLTNAAEKLTNEADGVYGIAAGYADQGGFYNTVYAAGGHILNDDKSACGFDDPATIQGIQCWIDLMKNGYSPSQASLTENADYVQFMSGKIGMLFAGDWFAATFADPTSDFADKCDVTYLPTINGNRATVIHGKANCINANSENMDTAWKWVEYLAGPEANECLGKSGAAIPAYLDYSNLFFEQYKEYNMDIFFKEAAECAYVYPASKTSAEWGDVIWNELVPAYSLEVPLEEACANITTKMNELLATE